MKRVKKHILPRAALAALIASVIVYCIMLNVEKNILQDYEKGSILVTSNNISAGIVINRENVDQYFEIKEMDKKLIPETAVVSKERLENQITATDLDKGTIITKAMFRNLNQMLEEMQDPVIAGFKAEDLYQVVSGKLRSGDFIHIYTVNKDTGAVYLVWNNIFVQEVFDSSGISISPDDKITAAQRVNILIEKKHIEQFYSELATGSLRVVKVVE